MIDDLVVAVSELRVAAARARVWASALELQAAMQRADADAYDHHANKIEKANQPEGAKHMGQYTPTELDEIFTDTNMPGLDAENISDDQRQAASALLAGARAYADTIVANTPDDHAQSPQAIDSLRQAAVHALGSLGLADAPPDGGEVFDPGEGTSE